MKSLTSLILLSVLLCGQVRIPGPGGAAVSGSTFSCTGFLVCQNFETSGTGYDNGETWTTAGSPVTSVPTYNVSPIFQTQSYEVIGAGAGTDDGILSPNVTAQTTMYFFLSVRFNTTGGEDFYIMEHQATNTFVLYHDSGGHIALWDGAAAHIMTTSLTTATNYYIWGTYVSGATATVTLWVSTSKTKPGSSTDSTTWTGGTSTDNVSQCSVVSDNHTHVFDRIILSATNTIPTSM